MVALKTHPAANKLSRACAVLLDDVV
jgi:hypothetical protein